MKFITPIICILLSSIGLYSQNYFMTNAPITACTGVFYDSGGFVANYSDNEELSTTICSDGSTGSHISLLFNEIDLSPGDLLCFYDGNDSNATQISCILDFSIQGPLIVQASPDNISGCLTLTFNSNSAINGAGWNASISCTEPCQRVVASLDSTNPSSIPAENGYIDICPGETVSFIASGEYPDNGLIYTQSDNNSTFTWNFGDGTFATGSSVSHQFLEPGGYTVKLLIEDTNGCTNSNFIEQRVRVAPSPNLELVGDLPNQICLGETFSVNSNLNDSNADIVVTPQEESFFIEPAYSDTLYVPDGLNEYMTSIQIEQFEPGQLLLDPSDLQSICFNMEHSYLFDLNITITCPSGNSVTLQNFEGFIPTKINLGEPVQNLADPCNNNNNIAGIGYDYCFQEFSSNGTMTAAALGLPDGSTLAAGNYASFQTLEDLLGCPLNGEWTISVTDNLVCDDGWIFSWALNFEEDLYPDTEIFSPEISSWNWEEDINISNNNPNFLETQVNAAGTAAFLFEVNDAFGCTHELGLDLNVLPSTHPECYTCTGMLNEIQDVTICEGESLMLNASYQGTLEFVEHFRDTPKKEFNVENHPPSNPFSSKVNVTNIFPLEITDATVDIVSVCVNLKTEATGDIKIDLQAPSGERLNLVNKVGGNGNNFRNTCFTPSASDAITAEFAPFTGDFRPMGDWNTLNGASVGGFWSLSISDDAGTELGYFEDWTISFRVQNDLTYTWTNGGSLSCDDCDTPISSPTTSTTYNVESVDLYNCTLTDEVTIDVIEILEDIDLLISDMIGGVVYYQWDISPFASGYEVNINNMGWEDVMNTNMGEASVFQQDDPISIQVQPYINPKDCNHPIAEINAVYDSCFLAVNDGLVVSPSCTGFNDGIVSIDVLNGEAPYEYSINGAAFQDISIFQNLTAGSYTLVARDGRNCMDSVVIELIDPPLLEVSTSATDVTCFEAMNGTLMADATGGTGEYEYIWDIENSNTADVQNLFAGTYQVIVTDGNNCTASASQEILEPEELVLSVAINEVSCYGGSDGSASIFVNGGTPYYDYNWTGGISSSAIGENLSADTYFVTVTDDNACTNIAFVEITEPVPGVAIINPTAVSCHDGTDGMATVENSGDAPFTYLWSDSNYSTQQTAENLTPGSYSVTLTDTNGCQFIGITEIINPLEVSASATAVPTLCFNTEDGEATVVALGGTNDFSYEWNDANNQNTAIASNLAPDIYEVTVSDSNDCTTLASVVVPQANAIAVSIDSTFTSCESNADGTASVMAIGGAGGFTYEWNDGNNQMTNVASDLSNGLYTVTLTDANNCTATETVTILSDDPITIDTLTLVMADCNGANNGEATLFASGGVGAYTYIWSDPNMQLSNPVFLAPGNYSVTISDESNCTLDTSFVITEPSAMQGTISAEMVTCFGSETGSATIVPSGGTMPYTYAWNDTNAQTDSIASNLAAGTYQVTLTDDNACTMVETAIITQPSSPIFIFPSQTFMSCFGESQNEAELEIIGGNDLSYDILWSNNQTGLNVDNLATGWNYISVTDASNCLQIDSINIIDLEPIQPNLAFAQPTCYNYVDAQIAVNFIDGGSGQGALSNYNYQWNTTPVQTGPVASGLAGDQWYSITVTDGQACQSIDSVYVTQPILMELSTDASNVTCFGESDGLVEIVEVIASTNDFTYSWENNIGTETEASIDSLAVGTYNVTVTDENGCSTATSLFISEPNPITVQLDSIDNVCYGEAAGIANANVFGGISPYAYFWSNGGGSNNIGELNAGMYYVTVIDANGCTEQDSIQINDPTELLGNLAINPLDCIGDTDASIEVLGVGGEAPYFYNLNGSSFGNNSTLVGLGQGDYLVGLMDNSGCLWDTMVVIQMPEAFELMAEANLTIETGDSIQLGVNFSNEVGIPELEWSSAEGGQLSCSLCPNPSVSPVTTTIYEVYAIDENGCEDTDYIRVIVERNAEVLVPTGFTPNADGVNDLLHVHGKSKSIQEIALFQIYDRWGELVYENRNFDINDLKVGWDGTFQGKELPSGVFVWQLEVLFLDETTKFFKGSTTLIR